MEPGLGAAMFGSEFKAHTFPMYATMRDKGPVTRVNLPSGEAIWFVTRHAEAVALLKDDDPSRMIPSTR